MKTIYKLIMYLMLFNIFMYLIPTLGIFPSGFSGDETNYSVTGESGEVVSAEGLFENISGDTFTGLLGLILSAGLGGLLAILTKQTAPIAVGLLAGTIITIYTSSVGIFGQFQINPYIILAFAACVVLLTLFTAIEFLTQGDVSD